MSIILQSDFDTYDNAEVSIEILCANSLNFKLLLGHLSENGLTNESIIIFDNIFEAIDKNLKLVDAFFKSIHPVNNNTVFQTVAADPNGSSDEIVILESV